MSSVELLPEGGWEPVRLVERPCDSVLRLLPMWLPVSEKMFVTGHPVKERVEPEAVPEERPARCCSVIHRSCTERDALFADSVTPSSVMLMERDSGRLESVTAIRPTAQ